LEFVTILFQLSSRQQFFTRQVFTFLDVIAAVGGFSGSIFGVIKIFGMLFSKIELKMELTSKIFRLKRKRDLQTPYRWVNRKLN